MNDSRFSTLSLLILLAAVFLLLGLVGFTSACSQASDSSLVQPVWLMVWSDEFNGAAHVGVDTKNWLYDTGKGYGCTGCPTQWGTGEVEIMSSSADNVFHDGAGHLAIKPIRGADGNWTSARIETQRTDFQSPANGILAVEASIQQPNINGAPAAGYWPAFWMLGEPFRGNYLNWPGTGEIDIMEDVNGFNAVFATLHCGISPGGPCNETTGIGSGKIPCEGCQTAFHTYRVEIDRSVSPEQIRWYLDGKNFFTLNADRIDAAAWSNAIDHGFFIILDVAMGGGFPGAFGGGPTAATVSGVPMLVDYIRVYESQARETYLPVVTSNSLQD